jgi:ELWxxDGT repeat protein
MEALNGELFFSGSLETEGNNVEPWKTSLNTVSRVQELSSGSSGSYPFNFRKFGNKVLFNANGNGLYATDGTSIDFLANVTMSGEGSENGGNYYFSGNQSSSGFEPWKTNGTLAGTQLIQELKIGTDSGIENLTFPKSAFTSVGDKAIFRGVSTLNGKELFITDGSTVNLLKEISLGTANSYIGEFYNIGNKVIFIAANSSDENKELYVSNGTPNGTVPLASLFTSFPISQTYPIQKGTNYFLFQAFNSTIGYELFIYFPNTNAVKLLKNINTDKRGISYNPTNQSFAFKIGQKQFFFANDSEHGNELWVTDGDSSNTFLLKDFTKQAYRLNGQFLELTGDYRTSTFVNSIYADDNFAILVINGNEVWRLNNNLTIENLYKSDNLSSPFYQNNNPIFTANGRWFFLLNNGNWYTTDGTALGTFAVANQFIVKKILGKLNNDLIFYANNGTVGDEVYKLDLSTLNISLLKDIYPTWYSSITYFFSSITIGDKIVFGAYNDTYGHELWVTDGTSDGTQLLKDINNMSQSSMDQGYVYGRIGNAIIFSANTGNGLSLWRTDGTTNGTYMLKDINSSSTFENFSYIHYNLDSTHIIFLANDYINGYEPFITDGTPEGTKILSNYSSGSNSSELSFNNNAVKMQNDIYFVISGNKLVRYNTITSSIYTYSTNFHYPLYFYKNSNQVYVMIAENLIYPKRIIKLYKITGNTLELVSSEQLNTSVNYIPVVKPFFNHKDKFFFALDADNNEEIYFYRFCRDSFEINSSNISVQNSANEYVTSGMVLTQPLINFSAGKAISLSPGFQTSSSGVFKAEIKGCQ